MRLIPVELLLKRACWGHKAGRKLQQFLFICCPGNREGIVSLGEELTCFRALTVQGARVWTLVREVDLTCCN